MAKESFVIVGPDFPADVIESNLLVALSDLTQSQGILVVIFRTIFGVGSTNFFHTVHVFGGGLTKLCLRKGYRIGCIQPLVQSAERIGGSRWKNLSRILVEEIEGVIEALLLAHLHGDLADVPHALARIQGINGAPVEVELNI